jgi:hypothetical protein
MSKPNISRPQSKHRRCRTGCVGVCLRSKTIRRKDGVRTRFYFQAVVGAATGRRRWLQFRVDTLGRQEAFRRAVRARAEYETAVRILRGEGRAR